MSVDCAEDVGMESAHADAETASEDALSTTGAVSVSATGTTILETDTTGDPKTELRDGPQAPKVFKMPMMAPRPGVRKSSGGLKNVLSEESAKKPPQRTCSEDISSSKDDSVKPSEETSEGPVTDKISVKPENGQGESRTSMKKHTFSPAELASQPPIPYKEPTWGSITDKLYSFEVIKNGTVVDSVDLTKKSHFVFGRLPSCDITMEHPSLSRYHAVVQHCGVEDQKRTVGWYLYDLDSTHGTWVNKIKMKPRVYHRLRVGHVIKFGGSSRLNILTGPQDDQDEESELSITEMKEQKEKHTKEAEVLRNSALVMEKAAQEKIIAQKERDSEGCSWGMDADDAEEEEGNNPFALSEGQNEHMYIDDPKKGLRGYFEREGCDLPEYDVQDAGKGKFRCTVELPLDSVTGEPMVAEVTVSGKKKDAVAACAMEACRMLDKLGELRKANHESRARKKKNWADADFYDSDDDTFLDRTGDIEKKRQKRMKKHGKEEKKTETYESLVSQLDDVEKQLKDLQEQLDKAKLAEKSLEEDGLDALDAYMSSIKSGTHMDRKTKMKIKRQLFDLKPEQQRLQKLVNIARPANFQNLSLTAKSSAMKKLPMFGKRFGASKPLIRGPVNVPKPAAPTPAADDEEEEEEEGVSAKGISEATSMEQGVTSMEQETTSMEQENPVTTDTITPDGTHGQGGTPVEQSPRQSSLVMEAANTDSHEKKKKSAMGPTIPPQLQVLIDAKKEAGGGDGDDDFDELPSAKKRSKKKKLMTSQEALEYEDPKDPKFSTWVPPQGQSGDGKTHLNAKFGY